jgi:hypothetical protein
MSEWLLLSANSAIFQPYHDENKVIFNELTMRSTLILDQHPWLDFLIVLTHGNNSQQKDMSHHLDTLS